MAADTAPAWFLELQGRKVGPYTIDQIEGLLRDGEIPADQKTTADYLNGRWIGVQDLIQAYHRGQDQVARGHFEPPPKPAPSDQAPLERRVEDSTTELFSTLQMARDRKNAQRAQAQGEVDPSEWGQLARPGRRIPSQAYLIAALGALSGLMLWGVWHILKSAPDPAAAATQLAPVRSTVHTPVTASVGGSAPAPRAAPRKVTPPKAAPLPLAARPSRPSRPPIVAPPPRVATPVRPVSDYRDRDLERDRDRERDDRDERDARDERDGRDERDARDEGDLDRDHAREDLAPMDSYGSGTGTTRATPPDPSREDSFRRDDERRDEGSQPVD
jgi:hypothetical protein